MSTVTSSAYWSTGIDQLKAYVPGEQPQTDGWVKLNTNECPYPPSLRSSLLIGVWIQQASPERLCGFGKLLSLFY